MVKQQVELFFTAGLETALRLVSWCSGVCMVLNVTEVLHFHLHSRATSLIYTVLISVQLQPIIGATFVF